MVGDGKNFVRTMLELARRGVNPAVVSDQVGRPTFTGELARAVDHLLAGGAAYGTYNVSNGGPPVSWADFAREIFRQAGLPTAVTDVTTAAFTAGAERVAPRPPGKQPAAGQDRRPRASRPGTGAQALGDYLAGR